MSAPSTTPARSGARRLSETEFVALMALIFALLALSIDSMLPAFPDIAAQLTPEAPNRAQLILSVFILSMGVGTLFTGPLSDAFGRKPVITAGIAIYILGALLAWHAPTLDTLLMARALQGLGAGAPRVVGTAMVRDIYEGRRMAQVTSFVMTVFMLVPAVAPSMGQLVISGFGWRAIFVVFVLFGLVAGLWLNLRQPETLPPSQRRKFRVTALRAALGEVLRNRLAMRYILVLTLGFGTLFTLITSIQPIYDQTFGKAGSFPLWFMAGAVISSSGTVLNGLLVMRLGMRLLATLAFAALFMLSLCYALAVWMNIIPQSLAFALFFLWSTGTFFLNGMVFGNLNALALQPLGHIAGMAASMIAAFSTIGSALLSVPFALAFDGTPMPLLLASVLFSGISWLLMQGSRHAAESPQG
ncbi:multidrug effflux MFS transporter [Frigidibacter sp. ROC022]|uniref:multidrug effflux MFS transporter n=1 Tax=Frigidibacter sp. ROC022 TaxID=2971796 RepID=UPI00215B04CA|nr:multidrug effflux MFS transporter [Frigidibacter sp. ROC022]MCR8725615.1 multidrug effflux MFS transporter [Frigidibacter sp. ROC022]